MAAEFGSVGAETVYWRRLAEAAHLRWMLCLHVDGVGCRWRM